VDVWRPAPFKTGERDAVNNPIACVFAGIDVDIKVMNNNAKFPRVISTTVNALPERFAAAPRLTSSATRR
jgi:hypothetical protein